MTTAVPPASHRFPLRVAARALRRAPHRLARWAASVVLAALALSASPGEARGQDPAPDGWNHPRALELVERAQRSRQLQQVDTAMLNYRADARGFVYFLLDHPESGRQSLVRTDQVAVDVFWEAPNRVRQHIAGWRERKELPVSRLHYYLDRLTVVQDNYGDGIMIADGENVNNVPHPAAPGSESIYDFRLADSLTLRLPGAPEPVRVFELRVRPRDPDEPAVVGSVFVDEGSGAVVRMDLTFTRAAYIDRRLDHINVSLENGLWRGRFWLPHEQRLEIRREVPELDFPVGTIIRTRMRVGNYQFNQPIPGWVFGGPPITVAPRAERQNFAFEEPIDAEWRAEGIGRPLGVTELRREARQLMRSQAMSGLPRSRLHLGGASDLFRYNRAEGAVLGLGASFAVAPDLGLRLHGGYAFGAEHPIARAELTRGGIFGGATLSGYLNQPHDVGVAPASSGALNTLSTLIAGADFRDLYTASGAGLALRRALGTRWSGEVEVRGERHRSLERNATTALFDAASLRPVREIDEGDFGGATLRLRRGGPEGTPWVWRAELRAEAGALSIGDAVAAYGQPRAALSVERNWAARGAQLELGASAGASVGDLPRQALFLLGGRGTIPGYSFRSFGGDRFALGGATLSAELHRPWLRGRAFGHAGWAGVGAPGEDALREWGARTTGGIRGSAGVGVGIFYDLLRVDVARGVGADGRWEVSVEAQPAFWGWL